MVALVVFIVLMFFWLFFGLYPYEGNPRVLPRVMAPWTCVAILGYKVFGL